MPRKKTLSQAFVLLIALFGLLGAAAPASAASAEKVLFSFCTASGCSDGLYPLYGSLIFDAAGNLYGTTSEGGAKGKGCAAYRCGTVFELTHGKNGKWTEKVLHKFEANGTDGRMPVAGLVFDAAGSLYGTTQLGGRYGRGTVFQLTPDKNGKWTETVLHSFRLDGDGTHPVAGLIFDAATNLYGTTASGGAHDLGTVFELTPGTKGKWAEKVLYSFGNGSDDGQNPLGGLIFDAASNLYGTTVYGGAYSFGTVFQLAPGAGGTWTETVLHSFGSGTDGIYPGSGLIFGAAGSLYGTTSEGGDGPCKPLEGNGCGTVFELSPGDDGKWSEKVLHSFNGKDGIGPSGVTLDSAQHLYGTTFQGGAPHNDGAVFELIPNMNGKWTEKILHSFPSRSGDGFYPAASLIFDTAGNLYSTTQQGGAHDSGTVFEVTP